MRPYRTLESLLTPNLFPLVIFFFLSVTLFGSFRSQYQVYTSCVSLTILHSYRSDKLELRSLSKKTPTPEDYDEGLSFSF